MNLLMEQQMFTCLQDTWLSMVLALSLTSLIFPNSLTHSAQHIVGNGPSYIHMHLT